MAYPAEMPTLSDRYLGRPRVDAAPMQGGLPSVCECMSDGCHHAPSHDAAAEASVNTAAGSRTEGETVGAEGEAAHRGSLPRSWFPASTSAGASLPRVWRRRAPEQAIVFRTTPE